MDWPGIMHHRFDSARVQLRNQGISIVGVDHKLVIHALVAAVVDGKPSKGVHLWLQPHNEIIAEFDANTPGIQLIRNPSGRIITTK